MVKQNPEELLKNCLANAKLDNGLIDISSIDFEPLHKIVNLQLYDAAIDWSFFWDIFFTSTFKVIDYQNKSRALTTKEKESIAFAVNTLAAGVPYIYKFYYRLPDDYPGSFQDLESIRLIEIDQKRFNLLESNNHVSETGLEKILKESAFKDTTPKVGGKYIYIEDRGLVMTGALAFLESNYSPDRLVGLYYSLHATLGTVKTDNFRRHMPTPRVFNAKNEYISNFNSPIKSHRAATISFQNDPKKVDDVNQIYKLLTVKQEPTIKESARVQICNALYWYLEFLNADDWSLQLVFLVSVIDSLFPTRKSSITKRNIIPAVTEKAPVIAATISNSETEKVSCIDNIEKLFNARNEVIHGKIEIHGYSKATSVEKLSI